ncbi:hypothetical protein JAAARDRAFT_46576 [Jaapia argillacea MUCL 33604]|uniref:Aminoglycoside phosphotransferase domain-containing protein n=1 Tax=Jaapia argillacea MUCL 33604 TaxID=933084 RepID=A0A067PVV6_9AGAM|nr:hypothetical protein JAAARDRAFT_46576 [Jaapia argillacea MUCL 33604]
MTVGPSLLAGGSKAVPRNFQKAMYSLLSRALQICSTLLTLPLCCCFETIVTIADWWQVRHTGWLPGKVRFLPFGLVLKVGCVGTASEADILRFISKSTRIPVPRVILSATGLGRHYTLMTRAVGRNLQNAWQDMDAEQQTKIISQLRDFVDQLRALMPPDAHRISGFDGGPLLDSRLPGSQPCGPFSSEKDFNEHLLDCTRVYVCDEIVDEIRPQLSLDHRIYFTHADLAARNIIVDGDQIVALLDWENSGWFPEYWEFVKARHYPALDKSWDDSIATFAHDYTKEWMVDRRMSDYIVGAI